jgi:hypothetical protein
MLLLWLFTQPIAAQSPIDGILIPKGEFCVGLFYTQDNWNEYWEGTLKRDNGNVGTLKRQTVTPMVVFGLSDRINVLAALPWVRTHATAGQIRGASGLQDWGVWVKAEVLKAGHLSLQAAVGATGPASNYLPDYFPLNLGLGNIEGTARAIAEYRLDNGSYARVQAGYHLRSNTTIERTYYYTTQGYYSDQVDMPNAVTYSFAIGRWMKDDAFRAELIFDGLHTTGGHDIRRQDVGFPSNKMIFQRLGGLLQYYLPPSQKFGLFASGGYVLNGRNVGQSIVLTGGVMYRFGR